LVTQGYLFCIYRWNTDYVKAVAIERSRGDYKKKVTQSHIKSDAIFGFRVADGIALVSHDA
jgi:hypothetical protein